MSRRPAWPLQAAAAFDAFYVFVHNDHVASFIILVPDYVYSDNRARHRHLLPPPIGAATVQEVSSASPSDTGVWFMVVPAPACTVLATPVRAFFPDVSPGLANSVRRLVYIGLDNVFGIDFLLYDCLDHVTDFLYAYSVLAKLEYAFVPDVRLVLAKQWLHIVLDGSYCVVSGIGIPDDCLDASPSFSSRTMRMRLLLRLPRHGNPVHDIDHGDSSHGFPDQGSTA